MTRVQSNLKDKWLNKLAREYVGPIPCQSETDVISWLEKRANRVKDPEGKKFCDDLLMEAKSYGGSDDWGRYSAEFMSFSRLLSLIDSRVSSTQTRKRSSNT